MRSVIFRISIAYGCNLTQEVPVQQCPHPLSALALALCLVPGGLLSATAHAATDRKDNSSTLETITVVGTRTERTLGEVEATISVYDREDIERWLVRDIQDLVRFEPGVSVGGSGNRFGLEGFTIRGIGGNRVLTMVDGIRMPEEFSFGPFLAARRDFVDVDTVSRVEIARGPSSTLYGSDALGGVVAITTRAPNEYVSSEDPLYLDAKTGYSSEDNSVVGSLNAAYGTERLAGLITYTQRSGEETDTGGDQGGFGQERSRPDPQSIDTRALGAKLAFSPAQGHNLIFALDLLDSQVDTELLSDIGVVERGIITDSRNAQDERERERYSLSYRYDSNNGLIDNAQVTVYRQTSESTQLTLDQRTSPRSGGLDRQRLSTFEQQIDGLFAQLSRSFAALGANHTLTGGIDWYRTDNENQRDGFTLSMATGAVLPEFQPLPTRDFPRTEVENRAFFLQDEMVFLDGRLRVTPGLRYDDYSANTSPDELYFNGNPGVGAPEDFADSDLTLKLGALYEFTPALAGWARYSEGFRAPPYDDVNVGFSNFLGGYKTIAAPDLASESSTGYEVGLRFKGGWGQAEVTAFTTRYDNFIEANVVAPRFLATGGIDPADGLLTFQSVNRGAVDIDGVEFRGRLGLGSLNPRLTAFSVEAAAAYASGESDEGVPVNTVDPLNAVLGLRWTPEASRWSSELIWTWSDAKDADDIDGDRPASDSFHLLDLLVHAELSERLTLDVGVFNLTDETYIRWADTVGIGLDNPLRFSRPGRNFSVNLRAVW
jgi:hemoglobin/transferrin/lactoferrin receptor protein